MSTPGGYWASPTQVVRAAGDVVELAASDTDMVAPNRYDLNIYRGDTYRWRVTLWSDAAKTQPTNLSGVTAAAQIRRSSGSTPVVNLECVVELPNVIHVELSAPVSSMVINGLWDLELSAPDGVITILRGTVTIVDDITNSTRT